MNKVNLKEILSLLFRVDLRRLILWMCLFFVFLALGNSLHAAYQVQHGLLLQHSLHTNRAFAEELARVTDSFFRSSSQVLEAAALDIADSRLDPAATQKEIEQLASVSDAFNAIIAVDLTGKIIAARAKDAFAVDTHLRAPSARQLLNATETTAISGAFKGPNGLWMSIIAHPILYPDGRHAGFVGGAVHLQGGNALKKALDKLHYQDGYYFYIVDEVGTAIYHPDQDLIGSSFKNISPVPAVLHGEAGTWRTGDAEPTDQLVSYAPISFANWGVIAARPTEVALSNIDELFLRTFYYSLPVFIISLLAIWWLARFIAHPLRELADVAANLDNRASFARIRFIKGWYVEAAMIRKGLMQSFTAIGSRMRKLHLEGTTDPLTGVVNRRGLYTAVEKLMESAQSVAVVMVDVDHFKSVNDKFGHTVGDEVLKTITALIMAQARKEDIVARMGGEEFVILLPETDLEPAGHFAERLRSAVEQTHFDTAGNVTISLGVARYPTHGANVNDTLDLADAALYRAKAAGRNRVVLT